MPRVLLLLPSATYRAEAFLTAAARLALEVTLGVERGAVLSRPPMQDCLSLSVLEPERSAEAVRDYAAGRPIHAVVGVDDRTVILAAQIAEALGLPHNPVESVVAAGNKALMRERLRAQDVPVPNWFRASIDESPDVLAQQLLPSDPQHSALGTQHSVRYPCVLKPLVLSASCGVIRADGPEAFIAAFCRIGALLYSLGLTATGEAGRQILVEAFVPGREVALEGLLTEGRLNVLALFDKPDPLDGPFFEETLYVTPSRLPTAVQAALGACAARAAVALGLVEGPVHAELRVNDAGPWLIEMAARSIGGRCSDTLQFASGLSLEELILRHALRLEVPNPTRRTDAAGVMMIPIPRAGTLRTAGGLESARAVSGIEDIAMTAECGDRLVPLPEGTRYLGFIVARGPDPAAVETALREAHRRLTFEIEDGTDSLQAPAASGSAQTFRV